VLSFISQGQDVAGGSRVHEPSSSAADERASNVGGPCNKNKTLEISPKHDWAAASDTACSGNADETCVAETRRATAQERGFLAAKEQLKPTGLAAKNHLGMWTVAKKTVKPPTRAERERRREIVGATFIVKLTFICSTQSSLAIGSVKSGLTDVDSSPLPPPYKNTHTHTHTHTHTNLML